MAQKGVSLDFLREAISVTLPATTSIPSQILARPSFRSVNFKAFMRSGATVGAAASAAKLDSAEAQRIRDTLLKFFVAALQVLQQYAKKAYEALAADVAKRSGTPIGLGFAVVNSLIAGFLIEEICCGEGSKEDNCWYGVAAGASLGLSLPLVGPALTLSMAIGGAACSSLYRRNKHHLTKANLTALLGMLDEHVPGWKDNLNQTLQSMAAEHSHGHWSGFLRHRCS